MDLEGHFHAFGCEVFGLSLVGWVLFLALIVYGWWQWCCGGEEKKRERLDVELISTDRNMYTNYSTDGANNMHCPLSTILRTLSTVHDN